VLFEDFAVATKNYSHVIRKTLKYQAVLLHQNL